MASPAEIRSALLTGLRATDAEVVYVYVEHVLTLVDLETCNRANIFNWVVEVQEAGSIFIKPNSVLSQNQKFVSNGISEVNRQRLLDLLL